MNDHARLLPLNALRAFEAAARHLSFKRAAAELHVTPAAISQQIRALETQIGRPLFERLTRGLRLTEVGRDALPLLGEGFERLAEASLKLQSTPTTRFLTVSVPHTFAAKWLVPRLDGFREAWPDYDIRVDASDRLATFVDDGVDVAIRFGRGVYGDFESERLMAIDAFPVCSPRFTRHRQPLNEPSDLKHSTLLHTIWSNDDDDTAPSWRMWLTAAGVDDVDWNRGPRFSNTSLAIAAAVEGHGVALASHESVEDEFASGRLIRPFPASVRDSTAFSLFLVYPRSRRGDPKVEAFHQWLRDELDTRSDPEPGSTEESAERLHGPAGQC